MENRKGQMITAIFGALVTILCIVGYIFALDPDHKYRSLWAYCGAICVAVIGACWIIQQSWLEADREKAKANDNPTAPQTVIIKNDNQSGGENIGIQNNGRN